MTITYYKELEQGSDEWISARAGILTASEMKHIITPTTLQPVKKNGIECECSHLYELLAQRITGYVEPSFISDSMLRGHVDEIEAKRLYREKYGDIEDVGFITNDEFGFTIGWSPDGLRNDRKFGVECKSRRQGLQTEVIVKKVVPDEHKIQVHTAIMVGRLESIDYVTYCGGLPMYSFPVYPDIKIMSAIEHAARVFEERLSEVYEKYKERLSDPAERLIPTERKVFNDGEIII